MKNFIVITSIYPPNKVIEAFSRWKDWRLVVVGDRKTPNNWRYEGVTFLSIEEQYERFGPLAHHIAENTYARKMLGYIYAISQGASAIFESDDDNMPYDSAQKVVNQMIQEKMPFQRLRSSSGWVNIYERFGDEDSWPRGFPIQFLHQSKESLGNGDWKVMQFLADQDPDVDAIYRMVKGRPIQFEKDKLFLLDYGTFCPFNSQATLWLKESFPLMFFPLDVSDRVTDILRGYIALACLWKMGHTLAYHSPIVFQERNPHNLLNDFQQELPLYAHADTWSRLLMEIDGSDAPTLFMAALKSLIKGKFISERNSHCYLAFLQALTRPHRAAKKVNRPLSKPN